MAGVAQAIASQTIGQELSLIGVPAPTTLDGYRPANPDEIKTFMICWANRGESDRRCSRPEGRAEHHFYRPVRMVLRRRTPEGVVQVSPGLEVGRALVRCLEMGTNNVLRHRQGEG